MVADVVRQPVRSTEGRSAPAVRRRAGRAAGRRSRHLPLRHQQQLRGGHRRRPAPAWRPQSLDYVLGITKAYTTRVGSGRSPPELVDEIGNRLATIGKEFGSVTGRPRRCGWFDGAALKRSVRLNGISGLCIAKLDVLDGLETIRLGVGYRVNGEFRDVLPYGADDVAKRRAGVRRTAGLVRNPP